MFLLALFAIFISLLYLYLKRNYSHWTRVGIKQLDQNVLLGSFYESSTGKKSMAEIMMENYNSFKNERYFGMYQFFTPVLVVKDPDLITEIGVKHCLDAFPDHANHERLDVDFYWSRGLFALRGKEWHDIRSMLSPAFTSSKMKFMFPLVDECALRYVNHFVNKNQDVIKLETKETFVRVALDMISACGFGVKNDSYAEPNNDFHVICKDGFDFSTGFRRLIWLGYSGLPKIMKLLGSKIYKTPLSDFFKDMTMRIIKMREENDISQPHLIHLLMQARKGNLVDEENEGGNANKKKVDLTDDDIIAQAMVFFFAGLDTTSYMMAFIAYELATNQEVQERLHEEIDKYFAENDDKLEYTDLMQLKYLDMIVLETFRKWPILFALDRKASRDFVIEPKNSSEKRYVVKKGDYVWFPSFPLHRDSKYYPDPDKFDPERFSTENKGKINSATYFPFGIGPRFCIGNRLANMKCKTIIVRILKEFQIIPVQETQIPLKISTKHFNTTAEGGCWLGLKKR